MHFRFCCYYGFQAVFTEPLPRKWSYSVTQHCFQYVESAHYDYMFRHMCAIFRSGFSYNYSIMYLTYIFHSCVIQCMYCTPNVGLINVTFLCFQFFSVLSYTSISCSQTCAKRRTYVRIGNDFDVYEIRVNVEPSGKKRLPTPESLCRRKLAEHVARTPHEMKSAY
jgi:hypothetical protein